ncbi:hypothetical protein DFJ58DRAFT_736954 [Suillus subalutaceus]|uniref:uncharacterized protein n=1 Tax=Suillus subalutaceus TaxID=48586 RepID=UPI001B873260|nr:uncharacterized protein DFJ58DRAFT_736954 [Suillus subalutaceus]KAG1830497.1 hypothetical protein DFJ58DRAFT_736954 [Suillus subalutaceus]
MSHVYQFITHDVSITVPHPSLIHHEQPLCDPSSIMPVLTRSMTQRAEIKREIIARAIPKKKNTTRRDAQNVSERPLPFGAVSRGTRSGAYRNLPEERSDDDMVTSTILVEEAFVRASTMELSAVVKRQDDGAGGMVDCDMGSRYIKQEDPSNETVIKQELDYDARSSLSMESLRDDEMDTNDIPPAGEIDASTINGRGRALTPKMKEESKEMERFLIFHLMGCLSRR